MKWTNFKNTDNFLKKKQSTSQNAVGMNLRLPSVQLYQKKIWQKCWKASWLGK